MKHIFLLISIALATLVLPADAQNRIHVNQAATGANTGASWADAFTDLQAALALAQAGDEVWVAEGTHKPTSTADRTVSFAPKSGVRLLGGFAGTETDLGQRDWETHPTVLSGDIGQPGDSTDNSYNVVYLHQPDSSTLLDGFFVRHGNADAGSGSTYARNRCGGGLYVMGQDWEAYAEIRNCVFEHNTARNYGGGAMVNGSGAGSVAPRFFNCRFEQNRVVASGGGLAYIGASWVERPRDIDYCSFVQNRAGFSGGGLYWIDFERSDRLDMTNLRFIGNLANNLGGGMTMVMGRQGKSNTRVKDIILEDNTAGNGSAIYVSPNGSLEVDSMLLFNFVAINNKIIGSGSGKGDIILFPFYKKHGFIYIDSLVVSENSQLSRCLVAEGPTLSGNENKSMGLISNAKFFKNSKSIIFGVSIFNSLHFSNVLISKNTIQSELFTFTDIHHLIFSNTIINNNLSINSTNSYYRFLRTDSVFFKNCLFYKNTLKSTNLSAYPDNLYFYNTILSNIFDNKSFLGANNATLLTHCYFDSLDCSALPSNVTCGPGLIIGGDPMFVAPDSGDYRLQPCSPLLNAGSNAYVSTPTDLAGNTRIQGGTVDIGAYEHQGPVLAADPDVQPSCPGGASGAIAPDVQDACPPLSVAWQSGAASGTALTGLSPGTYQITLTDAAGQSVAFAADVPEGDAPDLLPLPTPLLCGDTLGGSAAAAVSGAPGPFAFDWGPLGTDSLLTGLPPGLYPVTVTDARGCTATGSVQVERAGNLGVTVDALGISCHGSADGSLTVLPANGKPPFSWNWSNPPGAATPTVGPLGPGTYFGTLTDAFGCNIGWVLPLGQPDPLQPGPFVTDASDSSSADGSILLVPTGGTGPYAAMWSNGGTGLLQDGLPPGAYFATVTDANGCTVATPVILVGVTTSTGEPDTAANWQVLPNPASDVAWVVLSTPAPKNLSVQLWSSDGRLVLAGMLPAGADRLALRVAGLVRGTYFAEVAGRLRKVEKL